MNCPRLESLITDYLDGALNPQVHEAVRLHLDQCARCARLVEEIVQLRQDLVALPDVPVPDGLVTRILERTSGVPAGFSLWRDVIQPTLAPFRTPRFVFATVLMFVFLSLVANNLTPDGEVSANLTLSERADRVTEQVYRVWLDFNRLKTQAAEEITLWREDLFGRLDYHLITLLFRSYDDETPPSEEAAGDSRQGDENTEEEPQ